jgi:16S rRNA C967 or C1407 C5-methylase (RsmB/RsmF family)
VKFIFLLCVNSELFLNKLKDIYPDTYLDILESISKPRCKTFRLVTLKSNEHPLSPETYFPGPFENSFYVHAEMDLTSIEAFVNSEIYIQSFSSMIPAIILGAKPGEKVLDLCAAPGSKSSQISNLTLDTVNITCIDNNSARLFALKSNLNAQNIHNFSVIKANAADIQYDPSFSNQYDKVIADVPCSNEGNIRLYDEKLLNTWNPKLSKKISKLQKRIIASAIKSLKSGGRLIYSTCTYSIEENEEVIDWALSHFKDVTLEEINLPIKNTVSGILLKGKKSFDPRISRCIRVLPNDLFDGFFVASLLKS